MRTNLNSLRLLVRQIIKEAVDQNKDSKNDFKDVKIARMKASGMSKEEIKKKHPDLFEEELEDADMEVLGEPDQSAEEERAADEISTLAGGSIRGYQAPLGYSKPKKRGCGSR